MNRRELLAICIMLIVVGTVITPVYGTRALTVQKTIDVRKEYFLKALTDYNNYPKIFPDNIKSASLKSNNIVQIQGSAGGIGFNEEVKSSIQPDGTYLLEVISGDLKGTKIVTSLSSTWGFHDGTADGGTKVKTNLSLEASWIASVGLALVGDDAIKSAIDASMYKFYLYAKQLQNAQYHVVQSGQNKVSNNQHVSSSQTTQAQVVKAQTPHVSSYQITSISLQASPSPTYIGNIITFTGIVSDSNGIGIQNALVSIKMDTPLYPDPVMAQGHTNSDGQFSIDWISHKPNWYSNTGNFYAIFDGSSNLSSSRSQEISVSVY